MNLTALLGGDAWGGYWDLMRKYHRFEVRGLEHILNHRGPALIVGYHGKPGARDLIMLQTQLLREHGMVTHAVTHDMMLRLPFVRSAALGMQLIGRDPASIEAAVKRKEKLVVTPGGIEEAWGSFRDRYTVKWRRRLGYLKLAIEHKLPIIPVGAVGVDDAFYGLYNAYEIWKPLWDRYGLPVGTGVWIGFGPLGAWPFTPPFPSRIIQYVDPPIDLAKEGLKDTKDPEKLLGFHNYLAARVQQILDHARKQLRARAVEEEMEELTCLNPVL